MSEIVVIKSANGAITYVTGKVETKTKEDLDAEIFELNNKLLETEHCEDIEAVYTKKAEELKAEYDQRLFDLEAEKAAALADYKKVNEDRAAYKEKLEQLEAIRAALIGKDNSKLDDSTVQEEAKKETTDESN